MFTISDFIFLLIKLALSGTVYDPKGRLIEFPDAPEGYIWDHDSLVYRHPDGDIIVTESRLGVFGRFRTSGSQKWGRLIAWLDHDGLLHAALVTDDDLLLSPKPVLYRMVNGGVALVPGCQKWLTHALAKWPSDVRFKCASDMGWIPSEFAFMTPSGVIAPNNEESSSEPIIYVEPSNGNGRQTSMTSRSSLADWQEHVAEPAETHVLWLFAIMAGFSSCLLKLVGVEAGGLNFHGLTSTGKTTLLQVFSTVFGNGSDPSGGSDSSVYRWDATANGIELIAARHSDVGLSLDELGACDAKGVASILYNLLSGKGKVTMNSARGAANVNSWLSIVMSSGELPIREKVEAAGDKFMGGMGVRMPDVPVDDIPVSFNGDDPAEATRTMKSACGNYYGTAGPEFLRQLVNLADEDDNAMDEEEIGAHLRNCLDGCLDELALQGLAQEEQRVQIRFALVLLAGYLAQSFGILDVPEEKLLEAVVTVRDAWLKGAREADAGLTGVSRVAAFIEANSATFGGNASSPRQLNVRGYSYSDLKVGELYVLPSERFRQACGDVDYREVARKLKQLGLLHIQEQNRLTCRLKVHGVETRVNGYAIKARIVEFSSQQ
ncbi:MAG: DUF927 domain-containing protein [Amphritea sp.]